MVSGKFPKETFKGWYQLEYNYNSRDKVTFTLELFLGRNRQGYYRVYILKDRKTRGYLYYFAIEGAEYYNMLLILFPSLTPCQPPEKSTLIWFKGAQTVRDWMFSPDENPSEEQNSNSHQEKLSTKKVRLLRSFLDL